MGTEAESMEKHCLRAFSTTQCLYLCELGPSTSRQYPTDLPSGQSYGDIFLTKIPSPGMCRFVSGWQQPTGKQCIFIEKQKATNTRMPLFEKRSSFVFMF